MAMLLFSGIAFVIVALLSERFVLTTEKQAIPTVQGEFDGRQDAEL
ncbi:MAG TPA: hypothetical protein VHD56_18110 [Tepidisphaeraceae bacterium]|nr:hypothetical protein [Tepidisphaeraceae bacterium]